MLIQKPEGVSNIEIIYTVPDADHQRNIRLENEMGGPSTAVLEWYGTIGDNTTQFSGEEKFEGQGRIKRALLKLSAKAGLIFGRVVRYSTKSITRSQTDPLYKNRRTTLENNRQDYFNIVGPSQLPEYIEQIPENHLANCLSLTFSTPKTAL